MEETAAFPHGPTPRPQGHQLPGDWEQDLPAHLFFGLLAHVHLFGEAYVDQAISTAEAIIARADELGF